jgi:hypothetical protein
MRGKINFFNFLLCLVKKDIFLKQVGYTTGFWNALEVVNTGHSFNKYENIHHVKNYGLFFTATGIFVVKFMF